MRLRLAVLACVLTAFAVTVAPSTSAAAAPASRFGLTINATPNPIVAGEGVLIYGQLGGNNAADKPIRLFHRLARTGAFRLIGTTTTNSFGFYSFQRTEGVVFTNRSWFVIGPDGQRSRTIRERVAAAVTIVASASSGTTGQPFVFRGHLTPNHAGERVELQVQKNSADEWRTLKFGRIGPGSNYTISWRFRIPGPRVIRVLFPGDRRNIKSPSDQMPVTIQQREVPDFTISTATPIVTYGQQATISGVLYQPGSTNPDPNVALTLCGHPITDPSANSCQAAITSGDGSYQFTVSPTQNEEYLAFTTLSPHRHSANLFLGVGDIVSLSASSTTVQAGQPVTFTGTVTPNKAGDVVYLQRLGADGEWHPLAARPVQGDSSFQFVRTFGAPGTYKLRVRILGDRVNIGGTAAPVTITVTPASTSSPPPAS